jgi:soluble lytic murein transglycosylase-like protein
MYLVFILVIPLILIFLVIRLNAEDKKLTENAVKEIISNSTPAMTLDELIKYKAGKYGIEERLLRAIIKVESNFNPQAKNPLDPSYGLCQIMPSLAKGLGFFPDEYLLYDPAYNLEIAGVFLSHLKRKYNNDLDSIIQAYNLGETKFDKGYKSPDYLEKVKKYYYQGI